MIVQVTPFTAHERQRIKQHGKLWRVKEQNRIPEDKSRHFTESVTTGYVRWWPKTQCREVENAAC